MKRVQNYKEYKTSWAKDFYNEITDILIEGNFEKYHFSITRILSDEIIKNICDDIIKSIERNVYNERMFTL